jgi:hypothetical protein
LEGNFVKSELNKKIGARKTEGSSSFWQLFFDEKNHYFEDLLQVNKV